MAYIVRTKDDPLDAGRSADQQASVDNDSFFYSDIKYVQLEIAPPASGLLVGNNQRHAHLPAGLDGMNLVYVNAIHATAGSGGSPTLVQVRNVTDAVDVLSTRVMVDVGETDSAGATTPYVINTANDDVDTGDVWAIDLDQLPTTSPLGLVLTLGFQRV